MQISLRLAEETERSFCESLSRENMKGYRAARGIQWDPDRFNASWNEFENLVIICGDQLVGTVRLLPEGEELGLRDLQVLPERQGEGIGSLALEQTKQLAVSRGYDRLRLRVFSENPAKLLYVRSGFETVGDMDGTLHMVWRLSPNNSFKPSPLRGLVQVPLSFTCPRPQTGPA